LAEEALNREAFEMCCEKKSDKQVVSSDYFYSMIELLNGDIQAASLLRPKKYKEFKSLKSESEEYKQLKLQREEILQQLAAKMRDNKPSAFMQMLVAQAKEGLDFDAFELPPLGRKYNQAVDELKKAYEDYRQAYATASTKYQQLGEICKLSEISPPQVIKSLGEKKKEDIGDWDGLSLAVFNGIAGVWDTHCEGLYSICKKNKKDKGVPRNFTGTLRKAIKNDDITHNFVFQIVCQAIWNGLQNNIDQENDTSKLDECFKQNDKLIQKYAALLVEPEIEQINAILSEQKKHAMARFCGLIANYNDFLRHTKILERKAEELFPGKGEIVRAILIEIIRHSHYEIADEKEIEDLRQSNKKPQQEKLKKIEGEKKLLTVKDNHHDTDIMGYEKKGHYLPDAKSNAIRKINQTMQLYGTKNKVSNFQHAHTFPFPAMFNWKPKKVRNILSSHQLQVDHNYIPQHYIQALFFKAVRDKRDTRLLDDAFLQQLDKIQAAAPDNPAKFIYTAIDLLKHYHLRVFSETELVPDFINTELDQLSEWKGSKDTYKKSLATGVVKLLEKNEISKEDVALALQPFFKETDAKINRQVKAWESDKSIFNLVQQIGALHVQQARTLGWLEATFKADELSVVI